MMAVVCTGIYRYNASSFRGPFVTSVDRRTFRKICICFGFIVRRSFKNVHYLVV